MLRPSFPIYKPPPPPPPPPQYNGTAWKHALKRILADPNKNSASYFFDSERIAILYDAYPKAQIHLLVVPKKETVDSVSELKTEHIPLLEEMKEMASSLSNQ